MRAKAPRLPLASLAVQAAIPLRLAWSWSRERGGEEQMLHTRRCATWRRPHVVVCDVGTGRIGHAKHE